MDSDAINYGGCGLNMKPCMQVVEQSFLVVTNLATTHINNDGRGENYFIWVTMVAMLS